MTRWIIRNGQRAERVYSLPHRCPRCRSREAIYADLRETYAFMTGPWVVERCADCDHNRTFRLVRDESDPPTCMSA